MKWGHLPERAAGWRWPAWKMLGGGADGGIKCAVKQGCLHCGFTSATSHPLFKTIISCSIIHTIFTRANYTRPCHAEKMGCRVFYCCTHRLEMRGCSTGGRNLWLDWALFSGSVPRSVTRVTFDAECTNSTFQFKLIQPPSLLSLWVNMNTQNSPPWNRSWRVIQKQHRTRFSINVNTDHQNHPLKLVQLGTNFKDNKHSSLCLHTLLPCFPAYILNITLSSII